LRPEVQIVEGRLFRSGLREIIIGRALQQRVAGLDIGSTIQFADSAWNVVGVFESGRDAHESEVWGDVETLRSAYRAGYSSVMVRLQSPHSLETLRHALSDNPSLTLKVQTEKEYTESRAAPMRRVLFIIGFVIGGIMTVGAFFAAVNTMYSVVSTRTVEIATLRAIGFGAPAIIVSVIGEALLLALAGGAIGALVSWLAFDGHLTSTYSDEGMQLAFPVTVSTGLVSLGLVWACAIGLIGGLIPALRSVRAPVAVALRAR